jgi:DNA-binding response OmpR family regulator
MPTILIVDDEKELRLLYQKELEARDYNVFTAGSLQETKELFAGVNFDLMVIDIRLAEKESGLDVLRWIRRLNKDIPIIINSAYPSYKLDFSTWLADEYIVKSGDLDELVKAIEKLTKKSNNKQ